MFDSWFVIAAFALLAVKHFIVDFPLQAFPYQYQNKGTYGHPGGLLHSGLHGVGTFAVFAGLFLYRLDWEVALVWKDVVFAAGYLAVVDALLHYHIDWAKMNINRHYGWTATTSEKFWVLLGVDQLLHALTYVLLVSLVVISH